MSASGRDTDRCASCRLVDLGRLGLKIVQIGDCPLSVGGRGKDEALLVGQHLQPRRKITCVIGARLEFGYDTEIRTEETRSQLRDQLFARPLMAILRIAAEIAIGAMRRRGPMHAFMRERGGIAFSVTETLEWRHLDDVE